MVEISVIVPVYNAGEFLAPCIDSVLAQSLDNWELLLIDDASTDGSLDVCRKYAAQDNRIRLLPLAENRGVSYARNYGLESARGHYVSFLDSDDCLAGRFLERLYYTAREQSSDVVAANFSREKFDGAYDSVTPLTYTAESAVAEILYQRAMDGSMCGKLFSKSLFENERFSSGRFEDLDMFYRVFLRANKVVWVPLDLYLYTVNPASYMQNFNPGRAIVLDVTDRIVEFMAAGYPSLLPAARDRALSASFNILALLSHHKCDEPEIAERCRTTIRRYRWQSLVNPKVRFKNKVAILITYLFGVRSIEWIATRLHKV